MKKKIIIALITTLTASMLYACGNEKVTETSVTPTPAVSATDTPAPTPTATNTPTPTNTPIPIIVTNDKYNTTVFLGDYKGIKVSYATKEEIEEKIKENLEPYYSEVEVDRPAQAGDLLLIYFVGTIDGVPFDGGTYEEGMGYELVLGSGSFIDGFEEQLVGTKAGEVKDVNVTFPENYGVDELNGKAAVFKVTVNDVLEYQYPELTDEFVKEYFDVDTVEEYRKSVEEELNKNGLTDQINNYLFTNFRLENLSDEELKAYSDNMFNFYYKQAAVYAAYLNEDLNRMLYYYFGVPSLDELRRICDFVADNNVRLRHYLVAIAKNEGFEVTDDELNAWMEENKEDYGYNSLEEFLTSYDKEEIRDTILMDRVSDFLLSNAVIQ